jgi:tetratricopeptide (TPR) repeat protein
MKVNLSEIPGAFHLPSPNWETIEAWINQHIAEKDRPLAWSEAVAQWLLVLNSALGGSYHIQESAKLLMFCPRDFRQTAALLDYSESGLGAIGQLLGDVGPARWRGPIPVLLFGDRDTYFTYLSQFYPEGEWGGSGGMCFKEGYVHIALHPGTVDGLQIVIAHEITHAYLAHLPLPQWLEEGITQMMEGMLHSHGGFSLDAEKAQQVKNYWRENGLRAFWWGDGFVLPDEAQQFSYRLAAILFHLIANDYRQALPSFLRHAHSDDAGESAAQEFLGKSLADLAAQFLGPGTWTPVPADAGAYCRRGYLYGRRNQLDLAIADYSEAIRLEPRLVAAYTGRGSVYYQLRKYGEAIHDYEEALRIAPNNIEANNNLAWTLATCPDGSHRDGQRAVEHGTRACELSGFDTWFCLGTLAAAYAETGEFAEARQWAKESLRRAPEEERTSCQDRLRMYKEKTPYRDMPTAKP